MSSPLPFVSIIIPTYNRSSSLRNLIESLFRLEYPKHLYEIIICDNNSTDKTAIVVEDLSAISEISLRYVFEKHQGAHFARNTGANVAQGDILYFTDDDMIADPLLLDELVKVFDADPRIGCATGKIVPKFQSPPPSWVSKYMINAHLSVTNTGQTEEFLILENGLVYSDHQAIKRSVFFEAGGFNPDYFIIDGFWVGDGETGLNEKVKALGYVFAYTAKSITYHNILPEKMTFKYLLWSFKSSGHGAAYSSYRLHRRPELIIPKMIQRNTFGLIKLFLQAINRILRQLEPVRFLLGHILYLFEWNKFDYKLLSDREFRRIVEMDNWLTINDNSTIDYLTARFQLGEHAERMLGGPLTLRKYILRVINRFLALFGFELQRPYRYVNMNKINIKAQKVGMTACEYLEKQWGAVGLRDYVIKQLHDLNVLLPCDQAVEIGPGSGIFLDAVMEKATVKQYHIYEIDKKCIEYLAKKYPERIVTHLTDGYRLSGLQDKTCGICVSHQVLVCLSLLNCYCYFYELIRVCREGGFIAFDIYSDEEWNQQVIDSWLPLVKNSDPTVLSEKRIIELFSSHGCQLIGKFNAQTGFDFTTYLVFKKGDSKSSPVSL